VSAEAFISKTLSWDDLKHPRVAPTAGELRSFAMKLGVSGVPFAVNGVLKRRFWVRRHKLWEYARGTAFTLAALPAKNREDLKNTRVLDFGGGATLPVFYLAQCGCQVVSLDVDAALTDCTNRVALQRGWKLRGLTTDITQRDARKELGSFDVAISFSVLEHLPKNLQAVAVARMARLLKPGGMLALTCDYGEDAPVENALRNEVEVEQLVAGARLTYVGGESFRDTRERFALDRRHPARRFTFASLFLERPEGDPTFDEDLAITH
jgi:SAM-dependent methyltransferase